ncbi:MAG TPA: DUF4395 domain-containing protein [Candidatus Binatia bacterium]|jgi:hypothetical protein|nr:DUF4395 domain-containing protein [Candidatus Binatia bacterium]
MERQTDQRRVDHTALKVNQAFIIALLLLAFVLDSWPVVAFVGAVMLLGTAVPALSLFKLVYRKALRPAGLVRPQVVVDNPEPHRFAQGLGGVFLALGIIALLLGQPVVGWVLAWIVIVLAALNLFLGFCAGCFVYYQLNRLGLPGFEHAPITSRN